MPILDIIDTQAGLSYAYPIVKKEVLISLQEAFVRFALFTFCIYTLLSCPRAHVCAADQIQQSAAALRTVTLLTGTVTACEAVTLRVGMHVLSKEDNPWISPKKDGFYF